MIGDARESGPTSQPLLKRLADDRSTSHPSVSSTERIAVSLKMVVFNSSRRKQRSVSYKGYWEKQRKLKQF